MTTFGPNSSSKALTEANAGPLAPHRGSAMAIKEVAARPTTLEMVPAQQTDSFKSLRRSMTIGTAVVLTTTIIIGVFMARTVIAGAVVGQGTLVVESGPKKVQHQTGGIVKQLLVADGDHVTAGQPLVVLDQVVTDAQLNAVASSLVQQRARLDRLVAERDGLETLVFPSIPPETLEKNPEYSSFLDSERRQFALRREGRDGQRQQLMERVKQTEEQVRGDTAQRDAKVSEAKVVTGELEGLRALFKRKLVSYARLSEMERTLSQLEGEQGSLSSSIAGGKGRIAELQLQVLQVDQSLRSELTDQISETQQSVSELAERLIIAQDARMRSIITAPQDGIINQLSIHTVGGVIQPAETMMVVVPQNDRLVGEIKVRPSDIDQIYPGLPAEIHFSAFDRGTTPAINGTVASVSPDLLEDRQNGAKYYTARISSGDEELKKLDNLKLVPGMPLEVFIHTSDRTVVSYLVKPMLDQMNRAFR